MKKIYIILIALIIIIISAYLYLRYKVLKTKDFVPDNSKAKSVLDLRPAIIARLQQLVHDGSGGLYKLSIDELDADLISSTLKIKNATLTADSTVLLNFDKAYHAPDDVFKISFSSLNISGIGIQDLLDKNEIDIKAIHLTNPLVEILHTKRAYNKAEREKNDSLTLYQRLMHGMKRIAIDTILLEHGTFINKNSVNNKVNRFENITVNLNKVLIDSSTQYDRNRFLFAKDADISFKDYILPTPDSLYYLKAKAINISATRHQLTALNITLSPRGNREQFVKKLKRRQDMFDIKARKVTLNEIDWYSMLNEDKIIVNEGIIDDCDFKDYFDRSVPPSKTVSPVTNFPHQSLMRMTLPVYVQNINLRNCNVTYEEFNPAANASGTIYFDNINGQLSNITNMPEYVRRNNKMKLSVNALFLHKVKLSTIFSLDLKHHKTGNFAIDVTLDKIDSTLINPVAEPLGLISIKKGIVKKVAAHITATSFRGSGKILLLYDDLHLVPLKSKDGELKKRNVTSFLTNLFVIKKSNPIRGKQREEACAYENDNEGSFFNYIWKILLTGILKTIGIPVKYAYK